MGLFALPLLLSVTRLKGIYAPLSESMLIELPAAVSGMYCTQTAAVLTAPEHHSRRKEINSVRLMFHQ